MKKLTKLALAIGLMAVAPTITSVVFDARWVTMAPMRRFIRVRRRSVNSPDSIR